MKLYTASIVLFIAVFGSTCSVRFNNPLTQFQGVFGQTSFKSLKQTSGFFSPSNVIRIGNKLVVADALQARVLIYSSIPTSITDTPSVVLGQPDFQTISNVSSSSNINANTFDFPFGLASDGTKLLVGDSRNNRVLIWNSIPTQNQQPPDVVLGQPDFNSNSSACSSTGLNRPSGLWIGSGVDAGTLYVADTSNNRVLVYSSIPTANQAAANFVIGQGTFTSCTGATLANRMYGPIGVYSQAGNLFISNTSPQHRVTLFSLPINSNGPSAFRVLGQPNLTTTTTGSPAATASVLNTPGILTGDGTRLVLGDTGYNRILIWNSLPASNNQAPDVVLGQNSFTTSSRNQNGLSSSSLNVDGIKSLSGSWGGFGVFSDGTSLYATDVLNHRILVWDSIPTTSFAEANKVVGQANFKSSFPGGITNGSQTITYPGQLLIAENQLLATSGIGSNGTPYSFDNRLLIWKSVPTPTAYGGFSSDPSIVLGQSSLQTNFINAFAGSSEITEQGLFSPIGAAYAGKNLYVSDLGNRRVLIFNGLPTTSGTAASGVIGQTDFNSNTQTTSSDGIAGAFQIAGSSDAAYIADGSNNRVLIFSPPPNPSSVKPMANLVLGQPDFTTSSINSGGVSASSLNSPRSITVSGSRLVVSDTNNNRVLIWNTIPTQNQQPADLVLGQPDFTSNTANNGGIGSGTLSAPRGVWTDGTRLVVADTNNHRVLYWKTFPTATATPADAVFGQPNFTSNTRNNGGLSQSSLNVPTSAIIYQQWIYISDTFNHRILALPI